MINRALIGSDRLYPPDARPDAAVRSLALAILVQAMRDIVNPKSVKSSANDSPTYWRHDALVWFEEDTPDTVFGSLAWVCRVIRADAKEFKNWVTRYLRADRDDRKRIQKIVKRLHVHR